MTHACTYIYSTCMCTCLQIAMLGVLSLSLMVHVGLSPFVVSLFDTFEAALLLVLICVCAQQAVVSRFTCTRRCKLVFEYSHTHMDACMHICTVLEIVDVYT